MIQFSQFPQKIAPFLPFRKDTSKSDLPHPSSPAPISDAAILHNKNFTNSPPVASTQKAKDIAETVQITPCKKPIVKNNKLNSTSCYRIVLPKDTSFEMYVKGIVEEINKLKEQLNQSNLPLSKEIDIRCELLFKAMHVRRYCLKQKNRNEERIKELTDLVIEQKQKCFSKNWFHPNSHRAFYYLKNFDGTFIDFPKLKNIQDAIETLNAIKELDPSQKDQINKEIEKIVQEVQSRAENKMKDHEFTRQDYDQVLTTLERIRTDDPFKESFRLAPRLFELVKQLAPTEFLKTHPHLASREKFIEKYPDVVYIPHNGTLDKDNIENALKNARKTLSNKLLLKTEKNQALLTFEMAEIIRDSMLVNTNLIIECKTEKDVNTLLAAFQIGVNTKICTIGNMRVQKVKDTNTNDIVSLEVSLDPQSPFKPIKIGN